MKDESMKVLKETKPIEIPVFQQSFSPIQDGPFRGCSLMREGGGQKLPFPIICHTHPTIIKPGTVIPLLKNIHKIYELRDTPVEFC